MTCEDGVALGTVTLRALDVTLSVTLPSAGGALAVVDHLFEDLRAPEPRAGADGDFAVKEILMTELPRERDHEAAPHGDGRRPCPATVTHLCAVINRTIVSSTRLLAFHAAVVTHGRTTLVLLGHSGLGKSTLTAALLLRGWSYVSDEALGLADDSPCPMPYARALGLSTWSRATLQLPPDLGTAGADEHFVLARELGAAVALEPAPVTHVLMLERSAGAPDRPRLHAAHRGDVCGEMLRRGFTVHVRPAAALRRLESLLTVVDVAALTLGHPVATADLLDQRFG